MSGSVCMSKSIFGRMRQKRTKSWRLWGAAGRTTPRAVRGTQGAGGCKTAENPAVLDQPGGASRSSKQAVCTLRVPWARRRRVQRAGGVWDKRVVAQLGQPHHGQEA